MFSYRGVCLLVIPFVRHALCSEVVWPDQSCMNEALPKCSELDEMAHSLLQSRSLRQSLKTSHMGQDSDQALSSVFPQVPHLAEQPNAHSLLPSLEDLPHSTAEKHLEHSIAWAATFRDSAAPVENATLPEFHLPDAIETLMQTPEALLAANRSTIQNASGDVFADTRAARSYESKLQRLGTIGIMNLAVSGPAQHSGEMVGKIHSSATSQEIRDAAWLNVSTNESQNASLGASVNAGTNQSLNASLRTEGFKDRDVVEALAMQLGIEISCLLDTDCAPNALCIKHACRKRDVVLQTEDNDHPEVRAVDNATTKHTSSHTLFTRGHVLSDAFSADWSWTSVLVFLPCVLIGSPLIWAWWQLEVIKHEGSNTDEIWTAHDDDLREIDILEIGASGVALLRRHSDRQFGILLSFVGIMLQIVFLYFIAVYSIQGAGKLGERKTPLPLMFCSLFCNSMTCCASFITGMKTWDTSAPLGYEVLHRALVLLDSFIIPSIAVVVGSMYLCTSRTISALVFSATSMAFVCRINMQIAGLMSWSLSAHGGRAFQPAKVCIKDSVNTMQYAYYSLIGSALIALAMMPVAIVDYF